MDIVMIGAGNVAFHLSEALLCSGICIRQVYSRTGSSAKNLADTLQAGYTTDITSIDKHASLYIITVSDDAVPYIIENLPVSEQLVIHTAGSIAMDIFEGKIKNYGVLYPLQTFSISRPVNFSRIPVFLEANTPQNLLQLKRIAGKISKNVYETNSSDRMMLHLAAVFGCNFVNYLYSVTARLTEQIGFDFQIMSELILETASKAIGANAPQKVQTGPAIRNDRSVILKHLELLKNQPELEEIYLLLTNAISQTNIK